MAASPALGSTSGARRERVGEGGRTRLSDVSTSNLSCTQNAVWSWRYFTLTSVVALVDGMSLT